MPSPKRWFPLSRDINSDPEVIELQKRFGLGGFRLWLEFLARLDCTENHLELTGVGLESLFRRVGLYRKRGWECVEFFRKNGWISIEKSEKNPSKTIFRATNYWKYHRFREPKSSVNGSPLSFPNLSEDEKKENPTEYPPRGGVRFTGDRNPVEDFEMDQEIEAWAEGEKFSVDLAAELDKFKDYHRAYPKRCADYGAAFRNWLREGRDRQKKNEVPKGKIQISQIRVVKARCAKEGCPKPAKEMYSGYCSLGHCKEKGNF